MTGITIAFYLILFFLGCILGSFSGVIIERGRGGFERERLPKILGGRSYCIGCKKTLTWWQLIPLFGQLFQGFKCFRCKVSIPKWYFAFEVMMGLAFVATAYFLPGFSVDNVLFGSGDVALQLGFWLVVVWASVGIFVADVLWFELNVWLRLGLLLWILVGQFFGIPVWIGDSYVWALLLTGIFLAIYWYARWYVRRVFGEDGEGLGQGDVMMAPIIGLLFPLVTQGFDRVQSVQIMLLYLVVSSTIGMLFWVIRWIITGDKDAMLPFLPSMMLGFLVLLIAGEWVLSFL